MALTPSEIVASLDKYIVGQHKAKRAVAIALRNRWRRSRLLPELQEEVAPKNILMIGPTGVGKTEIARRLARLANAPFIKVEATKFTEVGYVGRDVESVVRDLVESAVRMVKTEKMGSVEDKAKEGVEERLLNALAPLPKKEQESNPLGMFFPMGQKSQSQEDPEWMEKVEKTKTKRERIRKLLELRELEDQIIEIEVEDQSPQMLEVFSGNNLEDMGINLGDILGGMLPNKKRKRKVSVAEARKILLQEESSKLLDMDSVVQEAIRRTEQNGIIFIDELDKVAGREGGSGPDVSREGVQRDILPIVEGSTVMTKHGPVKTDYMLFIAAGAFHVSKPSDLIPELQGRFPIRVELESLTQKDFKQILTEPKNALVKQYTALLQTEGVELEFTEDGVNALASVAEQVNQESENIGARRLHTIMERLLEEVSFTADHSGEKVVINEEYVKAQLGDIISNQDLTRYIL